MVYSEKDQIKYSWTSASVKLSYEWLNHQVGIKPPSSWVRDNTDNWYAVN